MAQSQYEGPTVVPTPAGSSQTRMYEPRPTAWIGWVFFAGIVMFIVGCYNIIAGFVALFNDHYYLVPSSDLMVNVDYTAWGWVFIVYGAVVTAAGVGVLGGRIWARVIAILLAALNALLNLTFLAAYPIWSILTIALDIIVIYALIVHGHEVSPRELQRASR
jgi:hypothetical protein